ncbi:MAG: hypothetical protein HQL21_07795 [Candidatus Omnitrophica bacterium]|nr:hypothetical protein [Candidatus Omnitrophota bacterium]
MMMKHQMASFLNDAARSGINKLDKNSPLARELKGLDIDTILKEDIHQICETVTFPETMKIMSLVTAIKLGSHDEARIKEDIKKIARAIEQRIEDKKGVLRTPPSCRDLLFNL